MKFKVVLPILGFEDEKEFELEEIDKTFYKLKGKNVSFTLIDPFYLREDYDFEISDEESKALNLDDNKKVMVLNILTIEKPFINSTVNFAAPLIFNVDDKLMGQVILKDYPYGLAEPLNKFLKEKSND
jgi:flagellar assembly factor FliW